jgi:hypothetical protein
MLTKPVPVTATTLLPLNLFACQGQERPSSSTRVVMTSHVQFIGFYVLSAQKTAVDNMSRRGRRGTRF